METKTREKIVYFEPVGTINGVAFVLKFELDDQGRLLYRATHRLENDTCDCKGFQFRHDCRHLAMLSPVVAKLGFSYDVAQIAMAVMCRWLRRYFRSVDLPYEPYEYDEKGDIVSGMVVVSRPNTSVACPFPTEGCWRVYVPQAAFPVLVRRDKERGRRDSSPAPF